MAKKKASVLRARRTHNLEFKGRVVLAALGEDKTMVELCEQFELEPNQSLNESGNCLGALQRSLKPALGPNR